MFSFFKRKPAEPAPDAAPVEPVAVEAATPAEAPALGAKIARWFGLGGDEAPPPVEPAPPLPAPTPPPAPVPAPVAPLPPAPIPVPRPASPVPASSFPAASPASPTVIAPPMVLAAPDVPSPSPATPSSYSPPTVSPVSPGPVPVSPEPVPVPAAAVPFRAESPPLHPPAASPTSVIQSVPAAPALPPVAAPMLPAAEPRPAPAPRPLSAPRPAPAPIPPTPSRPTVLPAVTAPQGRPATGRPAASSPAPVPMVVDAEAQQQRQRWMERLRGGLRKTGSAITQVFAGTRIDEELYEELESALLMADTGVKATQHLLTDLRRRVKDSKATDPAQVKTLLADAITDLLRPLEKGVEVGRHQPTVFMVVGVNGAGKTTSIGKLTRYLADHQQRVLLAAADTFRAAAREQLAVWAERSDAHGQRQGRADAAPVEFVSQAGGDPSSVAYDAVVAGKARGSDVVIADTAGRLPTQLHLMEELKKIRRVITKAQADAPHEVLLVIDGNTGQNALNQVKAFDEALTLTGLVVTKLDGTAKGGVLAAIALWGRERAAAKPGAGPVPVYFIGVGEQLEDLQTFDAREFAKALLD